MASIINFLLLISVMCLVLGVGLSVPFGKLLAVATQYQLVLRGLGDTAWRHLFTQT